ncbi:MAG TPA: hypothetical protein VIX42_10160 [Edaphobacter sp.]
MANKKGDDDGKRSRGGGNGNDEIQGSHSTSLRAGFSTAAAKAPLSVEMTFVRVGISTNKRVVITSNSRYADE